MLSVQCTQNGESHLIHKSQLDLGFDYSVFRCVTAPLSAIMRCHPCMHAIIAVICCVPLVTLQPSCSQRINAVAGVHVACAAGNMLRLTLCLSSDVTLRRVLFSSSIQADQHG